MIPSAPADLIVLVTVAAGSVAAAAVDLRTRRVPNALTIAIASAGLALAAGGTGRVGLAAASGGCLAGLLLMLPGYLLGKTGGGDVKLLGALGTLLGPAGTMTAFLVTAIAGGAFALVVAARRRRMGQTFGAVARLVATAGRVAPDVEPGSNGNRFAYAPAIAVGACVAAVAW